MNRILAFTTFVSVNLIAIAAIAANVATVNGVAIGDAQLDRIVQQSSLPDTPPLRTAFKNQLIARELFLQEARKKNLASVPEVQAASAEVRDNLMVQKYLRDAIKPAPVTDEQVKARYDAIVATLGDKEYKPRLILVGDDATAQALLGQLKNGADFAKLARDYSRSPTAKKGGELDWVSFRLPLADGATQGYPLSLAEAIVKLPAGGVTAQPVAVGEQRFLVKLDEVRPTVVPSFDQVKPTLKALLEEQELERATAHLVAGLIKNAKIQQ